MRLIDVDHLLNRIDEARKSDSECADVYEDDKTVMMEWLNTEPIVDAVQVKHGCYWVQDSFMKVFDLWYCSECGAKGVVCTDELKDHLYCYHCGARMDGGTKSSERVKE